MPVIIHAMITAANPAVDAMFWAMLKIPPPTMELKAIAVRPRRPSPFFEFKVYNIKKENEKIYFLNLKCKITEMTEPFKQLAC